MPKSLANRYTDCGEIFALGFGHLGRKFAP